MRSILSDALSYKRPISKKGLSVLEHLCLTTDAVHMALWALRDRLEAEGDALDDTERENAQEAIEELAYLCEQIESADCALNRLAEPLANFEQA